MEAASYLHVTNPRELMNLPTAWLNFAAMTAQVTEEAEAQRQADQVRSEINRQLS